MAKIIINGAIISGNGKFSFVELTGINYINLELKEIDLIESVGNISSIEIV